MKTPYNKLAKIYVNCYDQDGQHAHIWKKTFKIFFSRTRRLMTLGHGCIIWDVGPTKFVQNDDPRLTLPTLY